MLCRTIAPVVMILAIACLRSNVASAQTHNRAGDRPNTQADDEPGYWDVSGVGPNDALIVHSSASVQSSLVGLLPPDAICLKNLGCKGGLTQKEYETLNEAQQQAILRKRPRWCQISFGNRRGWVSQKFLMQSTGGCVIDRRI